MTDKNEKDPKNILETQIFRPKGSFGTKTKFIWLSDRSVSTEPKIIEFQKVTLVHEDDVIFSMVDFEVRKNEKLAIIGESGSGKSQLLYLCAGLSAPSEGLILVNGIDPANGKYDDVSRVRRRIGLVFKQGVIINNISLYDNIALPLRYHSIFDENDIEKKVDRVVRKFKLENYASKRPSEVSPGVLKLVAFARAYVIEPLIYLIDEPFAELDSKSMELITNLLEELKYDKNSTVVITSSNPLIIKPWMERMMYIEGKNIVSKSQFFNNQLST